MSDLIDPRDAWENSLTVQKREVVRLLFEKLSVTHGTNGPRVDLSRLQVEWAQG